MATAYVEGFVCILGMQSWCRESSLSVSDWAAWVQAIGSIVAILASAGLVFLQHALERRKEWTDQHEMIAALVEPTERLLAIAIGVEAAAAAPDPDEAVKKVVDERETKQQVELIKLIRSGYFTKHGVRQAVIAIHESAEDVRGQIHNCWAGAHGHHANHRAEYFIPHLAERRQQLGALLVRLKAAAQSVR